MEETKWPVRPMRPIAASELLCRPPNKGQQILIIRLEHGRITLPVEWEAGIPVPIEHQWHAIGHDISSQDLEKMVLEMEKDI